LGSGRCQGGVRSGWLLQLSIHLHNLEPVTLTLVLEVVGGKEVLGEFVVRGALVVVSDVVVLVSDSVSVSVVLVVCDVVVVEVVEVDVVRVGGRAGGVRIIPASSLTLNSLKT